MISSCIAVYFFSLNVYSNSLAFTFVVVGQEFEAFWYEAQTSLLDAVRTSFALLEY